MPRSGGGVSASHESRLGQLSTFANHLGYGVPVVLPHGQLPDVAFARPSDGSLFVGDAKHTERPASRATRGRLLGYLLWLGSQTGSPDRHFAVAHGPGTAALWEDMVRGLASDAHVTLDSVWVRRFFKETEVVVATLARDASSRGARTST